jgi:hypothetical protein
LTRKEGPFFLETILIDTASPPAVPISYAAVNKIG